MSAVEDDLARIDEGILKLQRDWERFFSGQERKAPFEARQKLDRMVRRYAGVEIRSNGLRFRMQSLTAKYNALAYMWNRRLRALEEGRPRGLAPLRTQRPGAIDVPSSALAPDSSGSSGPPSRRPEVRISTLREDSDGLKNLFDQFKAARTANGESEIGFEAFGRLIARERLRLLEEKDAVAVDFRVATQSGKVALKMKPIRGG